MVSAQQDASKKVPGLDVLNYSIDCRFKCHSPYYLLGF